MTDTHRKKNYNIAIVSDAVYPYNIGGKEKRIYELSTRLAKKGHHITIYCMKWWEGKETTRVEHGVTLKAISPLYPLYNGEKRSIKQAVLFSLHTLKLLWEKFDFIDADHMPHLVLFPLKLVSILKRKKLLVTWNEVWGKVYWNEYLGGLGNIAYLIERMSVSLPDEIISVSNHTTQKLKKALGVQKPLHTIPNGIDFPTITQQHPAKEKSDIIYAGRLLSHKNVDKLIQAVGIVKKTIPNITCIIVGNGPEEDNLKKIVKENGLEENIFFYDFLSQHDYLYSLMKASKIFVLPSEREGFGIVALEANACGLPVITIDYPHNAAKNLVNSATGMIINSDVEMLAKTMRNILTTTTFDKKEVIRSSEQYDWETKVASLDSVYTL